MKIICNSSIYTWPLCSLPALFLSSYGWRESNPAPTTFFFFSTTFMEKRIENIFFQHYEFFRNSFVVSL